MVLKSRDYIVKMSVFQTLSIVLLYSVHWYMCIFILTRSSADADNRLDAFSGQSRSTNMVPFHM